MITMFRSVAAAWGRMFKRKDDFKELLMADLGLKR
jgi:hypothetical protein